MKKRRIHNSTPPFSPPISVSALTICFTRWLTLLSLIVSVPVSFNINICPAAVSRTVFHVQKHFCLPRLLQLHALVFRRQRFFSTVVWFRLPFKITIWIGDIAVYRMSSTLTCSSRKVTCFDWFLFCNMSWTQMLRSNFALPTCNSSSMTGITFPPFVFATGIADGVRICCSKHCCAVDVLAFKAGSHLAWSTAGRVNICSAAIGTTFKKCSIFSASWLTLENCAARLNAVSYSAAFFWNTGTN